MAFLHWPQFGRLAGPTQLILFSLQEGPKRGRELQDELERSHDIWLEPGTLYGALSHLEQRGWNRATWRRAGRASLSPTQTGMAATAQHHASQGERRDQMGWYPPARSQKEGMMKMATWLLHLYPKAWRERYEDEMRVLLEEHEITLFTWLDLLLGALDARLDPYYRTMRPLSPLQRFQRMRTASAIAFCAFPLSIFFYFFFILDAVDGPWDTLPQEQQPIAMLASTLGTIAGVIWGVTIVAAILVLLYRALRKSATREDIWLGLLPLFGGLVAGGALASHTLLPWPWLNMIQFGVFFLAMLSVPASIALAIARSKIGKHTLRILPGTGCSDGRGAGDQSAEPDDELGRVPLSLAE